MYCQKHLRWRELCWGPRPTNNQVDLDGVPVSCAGISIGDNSLELLVYDDLRGIARALGQECLTKSQQLVLAQGNQAVRRGPPRH